MRVGVEVGGTFTDLVSIDEHGPHVTKVPSVPSRPDEGAFNALVEAKLDIDQVLDLAHGSTVATNAVLERKGARVALITTRGFGDILFMQRHGRRQVYDLHYRKPEPVVARKDVFEVHERILPDGSVEHALDEDHVHESILPRLRGGDYGAVAICFLNAYVNAVHEQRIAALISEAGLDVVTTLSSSVCREFREYERASTTTLSAYVQPVIDRYLGDFERRLTTAGFRGRFSVMQSNGGRLPAEGMRRNAITALLSGPAAGVMGAVRLAERSGFDDVITFDMGGTSADVCLVKGGRPELTSEFELEGLPIRTPVLDINTVGAGGGSLAWIDDGGMLRVGPESAGADPGPACYGRGGMQPTVTDAHVACGTLRPEAFLGGRMAIDAEAARRALVPIAEQLGKSIEETADSVIKLANANIVRAIQLVSTERGQDPRDYALVGFGGAGPLQAARVAEDLGTHAILVPPNAGVLSAYGLLASDYVQFETITRHVKVDDDTPRIVREVFEQLRATAVGQFDELGLAKGASLDLVAEMRFVGQAFEVPVDLPVGDLDELTAADLRTLFDEAQKRVFFRSGGDRPIEIVSFRLGITAPVAAIPPFDTEPNVQRYDSIAWRVFENGQWRDAQVRGRNQMSPGDAVSGPLLIEDTTSTILVPTGWTARIDAAAMLILKRL